jgi:hypothetical protein
MEAERSNIFTKYWHELADGRIQCDLAPGFAGFAKGNGASVSFEPTGTTRSS